MALIPLTETGLRSAMRDRRYWQSGHPEREAYVGWVSHGWRALEGSPYQDPAGSSVVFVQAYTRVRDGHTEQVSAHQRSAPARTSDNPAGGAASQQTGGGTEASNTTPNGTAPPRPSEISTNGAAFLYQWEAQVGVSDRPHWPGGNSGVTLGPGYDMGAFQRSTLLRRLNAGDHAGAAEQFGVWVRSGGADSPGLIARRAAERRLFEFPVGTAGAVP